MTNLQPDLPFPVGSLPERSGDGRPPLRSNAALKAAIGAFEEHMQAEGFAVNTQKAFVSDLRLLGKWLGIGAPVDQIATKNLNDFLEWLLKERGVPCSPKSYARRVTTLKVFFGWLNDAGVLPDNPAEAVIQYSVNSPLPKVPNRVELDQAKSVTDGWRSGDEYHKPDARPHLLLTLLLDTGIKKGEAMAIVLNHIDRSDPDDPSLHIRYKNPRWRYKERKLRLDPSWLATLDDYLAQYQPANELFTCTARNLEYILKDVAEAADLDPALLSFENLRWAAAMRDMRLGVEPDEIRQKLGLSPITWRDTKKKLDRLVEKESQELGI